MQEALRSYLIGIETITDLVGNRISWSVIPRQQALPAIVLQLIDGIPDYVFSGPSGIVNSRVQVDCWARTYRDSVSVSRALKTAVSGFRGSVSDTEFHGIFIDSERDLPDDGVPSEELLYRISIDLQVWHSEIES